MGTATRMTGWSAMDYEILGVEDDDEVTPGQPGPPRRPVRMLVGAVLGLGVLAAVLLLFGSPGQWSGDPVADSGTPTVTPAPTVYWDDGPHDSTWTGYADDGQTTGDRVTGDPVAGLLIGGVCEPYVDGTKRLRVQFELVNTGPNRLQVRGIDSYLPLPGFLKLKTVHLGGVCTAPGSENVPWSLAPGESVLVNLQLTMLQPCPKPAPVQVKVRVQLGTGPASVTLPVLNDLGAVPFPKCT